MARSVGNFSRENYPARALSEYNHSLSMPSGMNMPVGSARSAIVTTRRSRRTALALRRTPAVTRGIEVNAPIRELSPSLCKAGVHISSIQRDALISSSLRRRSKKNVVSRYSIGVSTYSKMGCVSPELSYSVSTATLISFATVLFHRSCLIRYWI